MVSSLDEREKLIVKALELECCYYPALFEIENTGRKQLFCHLDHLWLDHFELELVY